MMTAIDRESSALMAGTGKKRALVVGRGLAGLLACKALTDLGIEVAVCDTGRASSSPYCAAPNFDLNTYVRSLKEDVTDVQVLDWEGLPTIYRDGTGFVAEPQNGRPERFGCIILTPDVSMIQLPEGLPDGVESIAPGSMPSPGATCLFLLDYGIGTDPGVGMTAIMQARENVEAGGKSFVLMQHVPVAHLFGELLYEQAKRSGVRFVRFRGAIPTVEADTDADGSGPKFRITVKDADGTEAVVAGAERVLVAGGPDGSSVSRAARDIASHDIDEEGFLLSSSVHCHSGRSFSNGVFAIGEATGGMDLIRITAQAASAAVQARAWMIRAETMKGRETVAFTEDCIRCLTCTRICPHAAFAYQGAPARSTVTASAAACGECGVCVAECPRLVLDLVSFPDRGMVSFLEEVKQLRGSRPVVVYGCRRSAGRAAALVELPKEALFCSVPCAGRVSEALLWATFEAGASGVLVAGCHHDNCASSTGTDWARIRVESVCEKLRLPEGMSSSVAYVTVAANEAARFRRIVAGFCASLVKTEGEAIAGSNRGTH